MNKIVREHYPAASLPEELRAELEGVESVRLTIEADEPRCRGVWGILETSGQTGEEQSSGSQAASDTISDILEELRGCRTRADDPVRRIRALRAEWDSRDELHERIRAGGPA